MHRAAWAGEGGGERVQKTGFVPGAKGTPAMVARWVAFLLQTAKETALLGPTMPPQRLGGGGEETAGRWEAAAHITAGQKVPGPQPPRATDL